MVSKEDIREGLRKLVEDFRANYQKYKDFSEPDIETKLVEDLFVGLLGWTKNDFNKQVKVMRGQKRGRADYAFKINDRIVFFLEVKRVGIPLDKEADRQVISYALSKRVPFAVSTNFEELKIFCVEQENALDRVFRIFKKPEDYINNLQDLLFLTKESFEKNLLLKKAEDEKRLKKRISIDKTLLEDLMRIRKLIADDIEKNYSRKYEANEKDEIVQRIIDRLIFIRRCEDVGINPDNLFLEEIKHLPDNEAYDKLKKFFKRYNEVYNSGLFAIGEDNDCDIIKINGRIVKKLICYLYESKDKQYIYNFDWIDADILGQVYEQYLGKILEQTKSGRSKLKEGQAHRKKQGIYYTPTYIVDYIVKSAVEKFLKDKKNKVKDIKILDPACGSGSFLIKAFDYLYEDLSKKEDVKQRKIDSQGAYSLKTEILKNNLYGIDLDNKAVEITKLNLLLKAAEKNRKLPEELDLHIKHGNSLIDDEEIASLDAFKWEKDFQESSFDVVIGNPPYGADFNIREKDYFRKNYITASRVIDSYILFLERASKLLKEGGLLGFIIPETWLTNPTNINLREYILKKFSILQIVDLPGMVFPGATVDTIILILQNKPPKKHAVSILFSELNHGLTISKVNKIPQESYLQLRNFSMNTKFDGETIEMVKKIEKGSIKLGKICKNTRGIETGNNKKYLSRKKENKQYLPIITGDDIKRYLSPSNKYFVNYGSWLSNPKTLDSFKKDKIILQRIKNQNLRRRLVATIDDSGKLILDSAHLIYNIKKEYDPYYILALANSLLLNFYFKLFSLYPRINADDLSNLPFKDIVEEEQKIFVGLVEKMLLLNKQLNEFGEKTTSKTKQIKEEIQKIDDQIDQEVYKLYGITKEEQRIIEESLS